ncbi:hypothetical protein JB92DRAFT_863791 [Gautieria morchelliformis]|nr:hypothetical protein JB92DRAFT_863791 [Gautieria morchelliformis]
MMLSVDQTRLTQEIRTRVEALQKQTAVIDQSNKQAQLEEYTREIYDWLSAPDHHSIHMNACTKRQETTGSWFVQGSQFDEWRNAPNSFLWIHGIPGAGKTVLCSAIIEEISCRHKSDPSVAVAYFYFDFGNTNVKPDHVLRSLVEQLSFQCASIRDALEKAYADNADGHRSSRTDRPWTIEQLLSIVESINENFKNVYIIFDALDECQDRRNFLSILEKIHGWGLGALHVLATSRKEREIEVTLSSLVSHQVSMDEDLVQDDIRLHVSERLAHDIEFRVYSAEEKTMVEATLVDGAHGFDGLFASLTHYENAVLQPHFERR